MSNYFGTVNLDEVTNITVDGEPMTKLEVDGTTIWNKTTPSLLITLTADKTTIMPPETTTLTATVVDEQGQPVSGVEVSFNIGITKQTATTNNQGVATTTYTSNSSGDVPCYAEVNDIESNELTIEDCYIYNPCTNLTKLYDTMSTYDDGLYVTYTETQLTDCYEFKAVKKTSSTSSTARTRTVYFKDKYDLADLEFQYKMKMSSESSYNLNPTDSLKANYNNNTGVSDGYGFYKPNNNNWNFRLYDYTNNRSIYDVAVSNVVLDEWITVTMRFTGGYVLYSAVRNDGTVIKEYTTTRQYGTNKYITFDYGINTSAAPLNASNIYNIKDIKLKKLDSNVAFTLRLDDELEEELTEEE